MYIYRFIASYIAIIKPVVVLVNMILEFLVNVHKFDLHSIYTFGNQKFMRLFSIMDRASSSMSFSACG